MMPGGSTSTDSMATSNPVIIYIRSSVPLNLWFAPVTCCTRSNDARESAKGSHRNCHDPRHGCWNCRRWPQENCGPRVTPVPSRFCRRKAALAGTSRASRLRGRWKTHYALGLGMLKSTPERINFWKFHRGTGIMTLLVHRQTAVIRIWLANSSNDGVSKGFISWSRALSTMQGHRIPRVSQVSEFRSMQRNLLICRGFRYTYCGIDTTDTVVWHFYMLFEYNYDVRFFYIFRGRALLPPWPPSKKGKGQLTPLSSWFRRPWP